ncbi:MAG: TfoX/Sxy family protein [Rhodospirillaceae bacterium]
MASRGYCDHVLDLLSHVEGVSARGMFGGFGLYKSGVMFALIADDVLYYKVGPGNQSDYEDAGSEPFTYSGKSKPIQMSYWQVPLDVLEDQDDLYIWTLKAFDVALKAKKPRAKKPRAKNQKKPKAKTL